MARIGLMLYTVRDECARDFERTLREVAEIGYEGVELFDLHGHEPDEVAPGSPSSGLVAVGRHASLDSDRVGAACRWLAEAEDARLAAAGASAGSSPPSSAADDPVGRLTAACSSCRGAWAGARLPQPRRRGAAA